jgi:hypothetical protein
MEKVKEYTGRTEEYLFDLEVFKDQGGFLGKLNGSTPPGLVCVQPGEAYPTLRPIEEEEFRGARLEDIIDAAKKRAKELGGEILLWTEEKY